MLNVFVSPIFFSPPLPILYTIT